MLRKVLLFFALTFCLTAFGQTGAGNPADVQPTNPSPTGIVTPAYPTQIPLGNGLGWSAGTVGYYGEGPAGGALLSTPVVSFESPQPTAGVSLQGRAGISNLNPTSTSVLGATGNSGFVYENGSPEMLPGGNPATAAVSGEDSASSSRDFGPSFFSNQLGEARTGMTLAQVADHYRSAQPAADLRTYTNADIRPARSAADEENRLLAANTPPALPQSASASQATNPGAAAPQPAQSSSSTDAAQSGKSTQLPASGSPLPLLGLVGLMSTGVGLCLKGTKNRFVGSSRHQVIGKTR